MGECACVVGACVYTEFVKNKISFLKCNLPHSFYLIHWIIAAVCVCIHMGECALSCVFKKISFLKMQFTPFFLAYSLDYRCRGFVGVVCLSQQSR